MSNTTEMKRTELKFNWGANPYCCGILEIGDFLLGEGNRWSRPRIEPKQYTPEEGLEKFQQEVKKAVLEEYGERYSDEDPDFSGYCLLRATVNHRNKIQEIAEEYLTKDGWELVEEFQNVNSANNVYCYQKIVPAGDWLNDS